MPAYIVRQTASKDGSIGGQLMVHAADPEAARSIGAEQLGTSLSRVTVHSYSGPGFTGVHRVREDAPDGEVEIVKPEIGSGKFTSLT